MESWRDNLVSTDAGIAEVLRDAKRIAVVGIKTEKQGGQPAYYVPEYLVRAGVDVVPVPVYYPDATEILDRPVYRSVAAIPGGVDMVNLFRRPEDVPAHVDDILAARPLPKSVWMQSGIWNDEAAQRLAEAGIKVVQNRCIMVEHRRHAR